MENTSSDSDHESGGCSRKRKRDPQTWERNVTKTKHNLGQAYTSYWTKKYVPKCEIGKPCKCGYFDKLGYEKINVIIFLCFGGIRGIIKTHEGSSSSSVMPVFVYTKIFS